MRRQRGRTVSPGVFVADLLGEKSCRSQGPRKSEEQRGSSGVV